jgi:hypothetical protein
VLGKTHTFVSQMSIFDDQNHHKTEKDDETPDPTTQAAHQRDKFGDVAAADDTMRDTMITEGNVPMKDKKPRDVNIEKLETQNKLKLI